ncbi:hypothetical protein C9374_000839 [Naegleria lovaniensis]|uniref:MAPEG family protein n=1 Tax=Naegleria lovaniensis TaxID=51637 RepID=A0AA88GXL9_NAELO|nr:uncharacterized protein C9374_000839 [Naegleria lovaniensis]KAG2387989.1 hypothetical protein C9374_000839 [Naegleria lovaniensis]
MSQQQSPAANLANDQKTVLRFGLSSMLVFGLIWYLLCFHSNFLSDILLVPSSSSPDQIDLATRLAFASKCLFCCVLIFPIIIHSISSKRFGNETINPLLLEQLSQNNSTKISDDLRKKFEHIQIWQRILQNSMEQFLMFAVNIVVLSLYLERRNMRVLIFASATFIISRILFAIGYLKHYALRALGFSVGMMMNVILSVSVGYLLITRDVLPYFSN